MASCFATSTLMDYAACCVQTTSRGEQVDVIEIVARNAASATICRENNADKQSFVKLDASVRHNVGDLWTAIIKALNPFERSVRNQAVPLILGAIGGRPARLYREMLNKERLHIRRVRQSVAEALGIAESRHDFSKDAYYVFIICGKYGGVDATGEIFDAEYTVETRRHFGLEPHHPEYEKIHAAQNLQCNDFDIAEMAIDRLDRNLAPSGGRAPIDWNVMDKYKPVFSKGDVDRKAALFTQYAKDYEPLVRRIVIHDNVGQSAMTAEAADSTTDCQIVDGGFVLIGHQDASVSESELSSHHHKMPSVSFVSGSVKIVI